MREKSKNAPEMLPSFAGEQGDMSGVLMLYLLGRKLEQLCLSHWIISESDRDISAITQMPVSRCLNFWKSSYITVINAFALNILQKHWLWRENVLPAVRKDDGFSVKDLSWA